MQGSDVPIRILHVGHETKQRVNYLRDCVAIKRATQSLDLDKAHRGVWQPTWRSLVRSRHPRTLATLRGRAFNSALRGREGRTKFRRRPEGERCCQGKFK
ncbi:hypothetical protein SLE2022_113580 [Rubroshorea leprosula]